MRKAEERGAVGAVGCEGERRDGDRGGGGVFSSAAKGERKFGVKNKSRTEGRDLHIVLKNVFLTFIRRGRILF